MSRDPKDLWRELASRDLRGGDPDDLVIETADGLEIRRLDHEMSREEIDL